ncbi:hypothetical protein GF420_15510 [candidate division GN15 bacterium]|nr:hypothetical protein [candidate division GN15 bacterium]
METTTTPIWTSAGATIRYTPEHRFDSETMRHFVNDVPTVLHCHHYATLFTQLATDAEQLGGPAHLVEAAAEAFYRVLSEYLESHEVHERADRIAVVEQYFAFAGLGTIRFEIGPRTASMVLPHSHIDEGWIERWGVRDKRVNYIGEGYVKAAIAAVLDLADWHHVAVEETASIVCGASASTFVASLEWQEGRDGN